MLNLNLLLKNFNCDNKLIKGPITIDFLLQKYILLVNNEVITIINYKKANIQNVNIYKLISNNNGEFIYKNINSDDTLIIYISYFVKLFKINQTNILPYILDDDNIKNRIDNIKHEIERINNFKNYIINNNIHENINNKTKHISVKNYYNNNNYSKNSYSSSNIMDTFEYRYKYYIKTIKESGLKIDNKHIEYLENIENIKHIYNIDSLKRRRIEPSILNCREKICQIYLLASILTNLNYYESYLHP